MRPRKEILICCERLCQAEQLGFVLDTRLKVKSRAVTDPLDAWMYPDAQLIIAADYDLVDADSIGVQVIRWCSRTQGMIQLIESVRNGLVLKHGPKPGWAKSCLGETA